ncbi:MAG TPA: FG-GAP-like repeat-containing protein [Saprospiraceae bacterium]|nr:FG-GAP-like repeat-containing protein [Saprospiraceae bacterium]
MKRKISFAFFIALINCNLSQAQVQFEESDSFWPHRIFSNITMAVCDINHDCKDDIIVLDEGSDLKVFTQDGNSFSERYERSVGNHVEWTLLTADFNKDNLPDFLTGGVYDGLKYLYINSNNKLLEKFQFASNIFFQGCNLIDLNLDGYLDLHICNDDGNNAIYFYNPTTQTFEQQALIDFDLGNGSSGNYGSEWCDVDNDGDFDLLVSKCRIGVEDSTDLRRINRLFINYGDYFQDEADIRGMADGAQTWASSFADVDNDGDFDCFVINHYVPSKLMINDGNGYFTPIEMDLGNVGFQVAWNDLDNDGLIDMIISGNSDDILLFNKGNYQFDKVENSFGRANSIALGDFNDDGFIDAYANYGVNIAASGANTDHLYLNQKNQNNWLKLNLLGMQSNKEGIGAKITCHSGDLHQMRQIVAGGSFSLTNSYQANFGLGSLTMVDSIIIEWPLGIVDKYYDLNVNQKFLATEGQCITSRIMENMNNIQYCDGDTIHLAASLEADSIFWSTGESTSTISVTEPGLYTYRLFSNNGCIDQSDGFNVYKLDTIYSIDQLNSAYLCSGSSKILYAQVGLSNYYWSTGDTTSYIEIQNPGTFTVESFDGCQLQESSVIVSELDFPTVEIYNDTVMIYQTGVLDYQDNVVSWYYSESDLFPFSNDEAIRVYNVDKNHDYFVKFRNYDGYTIDDFSHVNVGPNTSSSGYHVDWINSGLYFDATEDCVIKSVSLSAKIQGIRRIIILDNDGNMVFSKSFDLMPGTQSIDLDAILPMGQHYFITTDSEVNMLSLGTVSPQLQRVKNQISYPIKQDNVPIVITGNPIEYSSYYYFFDFSIVRNPEICESGLLKTSIILDDDSSIDSYPLTDNVQIFPNPSKGKFQIVNARINSHFYIYNTMGEIVIHGKYVPEGYLDLGEWPSGTYFVKILSDDGKVYYQSKLFRM